MPLTDLQVRKLPPPAKGQRTHFDDGFPGFGVRVSQGGSKTFVVKYGRDRRLKTLGRYPELSLKEARSKAMAWMAAHRAIERKPGTVLKISDALELFAGHNRSKNRERTARDYERYLTKHLPSKPLDQLTRREITDVMRSLSHVPGTQRQAFMAIRAFLNWCVRNDYLQASPIQGYNPISTPPPRDRILSEVELAALYRHCSETVFHRMIRMLILTGQRRGEVAQMRWDWIDADTITIPSEIAKNGRAHTFPIGPLTTELIHSSANDTDLIFPGSRGPWNSWSKPKKKLDALALEPWTLHDLRRSMVSLHAKLGTPVTVAEKLVNHVSGTLGGIVGVYNRYDYMAEMKEAVSRYEKHVARMIADN